MSNEGAQSSWKQGDSLEKKGDCDSNIHRAPTTEDLAAQRIDPAEEKKLLRRMDAFIVPLMGIMYLLCFLDRANIGNAFTAGMTEALSLNANQKASVVSVLYATYVSFECVWPILIKYLTPKITMAFAICSFGVITICTAWAGSYGGLIALRLVLGACEAGVFPCIVVYFSMCYKREELGLRSAYVFVFAALSGAFGGLVAYGLTHIHSGALASWQYIYIVEGIISVVFAPIAFFWIPNRIDQAWFLTKQQLQLCSIRYESNKMHYNQDDRLEPRWLRAALLAWTTYAHGSIQFSADVALYGISTFMPVFIRDFGYSSVQSQLLTVPVYVLGAISFFVQARFSDRLQLRGPFVLVNLAMVLLGYIILAAVKSPAGVRYFALFIVSLGMYLPVGLNVSWTQANHGPHYKRALCVGVMQLIGNSSGAAIGYIFMDQPSYTKGFSIASGVTFFSMCMVVVLMIHYKRMNRKRQALIDAGAVNDPSLGDKNPHFLFLL